MGISVEPVMEYAQFLGLFSPEREMNRRQIEYLLLCACALGAAAQPARGADATWVGPAVGDWTVAAHWSGGVVPDNGTPINVRYNVFIDGGAAQQSQVKIPAGQSFTIDDLSISAGDLLLHQGVGSLTLMGTLANAGTLRVVGESPATELRLTLPNFSITGGGVIQLSGQARLVTMGGGRITNVDNTIRGAGTLSLVQWTNGAAAMTHADVPGGMLAVHSASFTNNGLLRASSGAALFLQGPFSNNSVIEALEGSQVRFGDATTITGGTLTTAGSGVLLNSLGQTSFNLVTLRNVTNRGNFVGENGTSTVVVGTITNVGSINIVSSGVASSLSVESGTVTLNGAGTINLLGAGAGIVGTGVLVTDNWIRGQGTINWGGLTVINQAGGVIEADIPGATLVIRPRDASTPGFVNHGTLRATNGALLLLATSGTGGFSGNGAIVADVGSTVRANHEMISAGPISGGGTFHYAGVGTVTAQHVRTTNLLITNLSTVRVRSGGGIHGVSRVTNLTIAPLFSRLDLTDNHMVVDYDASSPAAAVRDLLRTGYANGAWTGAGIITSHGDAGGFAIGIAEARDVYTSFPATFFGQSVDDTTLLLRFTRHGDANFDGIVNLQDFNRLAANFGTPAGALWSQGDFNYDGSVNLQDFNRLAANFGLQAGPDGPTPHDWANLASAIPEPSSALLAGVAASAAMCQRRRRT